MAATRSTKTTKRKRPAAIEVSGGSGRGSARTATRSIQQGKGNGNGNGNGQATKAAVNKALGKVGSNKTRPVTVAQVQNDPSIKASDKKTIIAALRRKTEG